MLSASIKYVSEMLASTVASFMDRRFRVLNIHAQETQIEMPSRLPWHRLKLVELMPWLLHLDRRRPQLCYSHSAVMHISLVSTMSTVGPFGTCGGSLSRAKALRLRSWISRMLLTTNSFHRFGIIPRYLWNPFFLGVFTYALAIANLDRVSHQPYIAPLRY